MGRRVSDDLNGLADALNPMLSRALGRTALLGKRMYLDGLPTRRLSGVGRKGARLNVRYDFTKGRKGQAVRIRAVGPWQFIERGRRGGYQDPRRPKRRGRPRRLRNPGTASGWVTGPVHPGPVRRSSGPWGRTTPAVVEAIGELYADELTKVVDRGR